MSVGRLARVGMCVAGVLLLAGCAWQKMPPPAYYGSAEKIPMRLGVKAEGDRSSVINVERIAKSLQGGGVFEAVRYPCREGDEVDAVLTLAVGGGFEEPAGANNAKCFLIGVTLGAVTPWIGPGLTSRYEVTGTLTAAGNTVAEYAIARETDVSRGVMADDTTLVYDTLDVEMTWLAYDLSESIRADWPDIAPKLGK